MHPMGMPCLNLNEALDFFAVVTTGFCPVMLTISCTAWSTTFTFCVASPSPIFKTIFSSRGTCMTFLYLNSFIMLGTIFLLYTPFNLAIISYFTFSWLHLLLLLHCLKYFRRQGYNLYKLLCSKLSCHRTKDTGTYRLIVFIYNNSRILIKSYI